jgi:hypothetical protein
MTLAVGIGATAAIFSTVNAAVPAAAGPGAEDLRHYTPATDGRFTTGAARASSWPAQRPFGVHQRAVAPAASTRPSFRTGHMERTAMIPRPWARRFD